MRAHKSYFRQKNSKRGLALSTVMAICIVLSLLVAMLVSMATLNITTTQATISQREAYIQAKSALSFAESYYSQHGDYIPGGTNVGEGLVVFDSDDFSQGATFYESKKGGTTLIPDDTIQQYREACKNTYIDVKNSKTLTGESILTLNAVVKYGDNQGYELTKEFKVGGHTNMTDNEFTGSINYQTSNKTRYVRFHVRATTALGAAPYFYMWYNQISPPEYDENNQRDGDYNAYATSSIVNKLTFNRKYGKVQNGSWGANGPEGACAMSYEGNGWYVTQKTFNLDRNLNFVNGIITKTGSHRTVSENENDWNQQSWEFFGIPIPNKDELGAAEGVDVYFEVNQNTLRDMQNVGGKDAFSSKYTSFGGSGVEQLNNFVKYCGQWYTVYTKTDTAIVHYREANCTDNSQGPGGDFVYEGYGWWRDYSHDFNATVLGYSYGSGSVVSQNQYGKERVTELYVCRDGDSSAAFGSEEEANEWFVKHGDLSAGDYVQVSVKGTGQPVDAQVETKIEYEADLYEQTQKVPTYDTATFLGTAATDEELTLKTLEGNDDEIVTKQLAADDSYGDYYLVGTMNGWQEGAAWSGLRDQLDKDGDGHRFFIDLDVTPGQKIEFKIIQKPEGLYLSNNGYAVRFTDKEPNFAFYTGKGCYRYIGRNYQYFNYTNWWGNGNANYEYTPKSDCIRIYFDSSLETIETPVEIGEEPVGRKIYTIVGWMNDWGKKQGDQTSEVGLYELTSDMEMYADTRGMQAYTEGSLIITSDQEYHFKVAERDASVESGEIDWMQVYGKDGQRTGFAGDDESSVLIQPHDNNDSELHRYIVNITYDPETHTPGYNLIEITDQEQFYLVGEFNGWSVDGADEFEFDDAKDFILEQNGANEFGDIIYSFRLNSLQELGEYDVRVISSLSKKEDGTVNYEYSWGEKLDVAEDDPKYLVTEGAENAAKHYTLPARAYVVINFTYHKNDPTKSEITFTTIPPEDDASVETVHVGFHNAKLDNVNDSSKNSQFTTPWEQVYVTYYTETTGFNCFAAKKADDGVNWWATVPEDAEKIYFSNKKTNVYKQFHSEDFEYTEDIKNDKFKGSSSTIFFPITPKEDDEHRKCWTTGDAQDYNTYVNRVTHVSANSSNPGYMAYYGSTQCNYYDAPIVNVLNMLVTGNPRPTQKYIFYYAPKKYTYGGRSFNFNGAPTVSYQGEKYYYRSQNVNPSSVLIVQNYYSTGGGENNGSLTGYLYEGDMSLQPGNASWSSGYFDDDSGYVNSGSFNMMNRAGGMFVSDTHYRNGDSSVFNYGGYTPSWYTYRIPVSSTVTIKKITGVTGTNDVMLTNDKEFKVIRESANVNRPVYIFKNVSGKLQTYTYNKDQGVVDSLPVTNSSGDPTGVVNVSVYFDNSENWDNVSVYAYSPINAGTYRKLDTDGTTNDNDYYVFTFEEGDYCFFQFFDSADASAAGLEAAEHKSSVLYFTGEELGRTTDKYNANFAGLDSRTTKTLAVGSATGFTWYMHPRIAVMHAYLDLDGVVQMTTLPRRYLYNKSQGTYTYYKNDTISMNGLESQRNGLKNDFNNGNVSGGKWTAIGLTNVGDGLLEAADEFMQAVSEARIYVSDDVSQADSNLWAGDDPDECMVFMEGEQIQNSAFEYTPRWKTSLKNTYKRIMLSSYHLTDEDGRITSTSSNNGNCIWTNPALQTASQLRQYAADLRNWLDNPQQTIKDNAVRIIVDDTPKTERGVTRGGWGSEALNLYVKGPSGWVVYSGADFCTTTQANYYAFVFMFPQYTEQMQFGRTVQVQNQYWNCDFTVARTTPDNNNMVDGVQVPTLKMVPNKMYRFTTAYFGVDDDLCFSEDGTTETKTYSGKEIIEGSNSPTSGLNQMIGTRKGQKFIINFKYDTRVRGGGQSYTIFAGAYEISAEKYDGFYSDFGGSSFDNSAMSGIDLFTSNAKKYFTTPANYGMVSARDYSDWSKNRINSDQPLDIMTKNITATGSIAASAPGQAVNFRYNGEKSDTGANVLTVKQGMSFTGGTVSIAANTIDFRSSGSNDFIIDSKTIIFHTDTTIRLADGSTAKISHGTYVFNESDTSKKYTRVSLKSTRADGNDWRKNFARVAEAGTQLEGGKYVAK